MTRNLDLLVVYSPIGGGHQAAASAIEEAARARDRTVLTVNLFDFGPRWIGDLYRRGHRASQRLVPDLAGSMYFATNRVGGGLEPVRHVFEQGAFRGLVDLVQETKPRTIVSTHHLPLVVLGPERARNAIDAPLVNVVTDYGAHAFWVEPGVDAQCVPCEAAGRDLVRHGVHPRRIFVTGIPVKPAFERVGPLVADAHHPLRVLVTSGGSGIGPMRKILESFADIPNVHLAVVCGNDARAVRRLRRTAEEFALRADIVGYESDMARRLAKADVVVGKAGGLTVSETLTAGRPLLMVGTIPGNETFNELFVTSVGAGMAARAKDVGALAHGLRSRLPEMGRKGRRAVQQGAAERVVRVADCLGVGLLGKATNAA